MPDGLPIAPAGRKEQKIRPDLLCFNVRNNSLLSSRADYKQVLGNVGRISAASSTDPWPPHN
jgi:hypothetical protein